MLWHFPGCQNLCSKELSCPRDLQHTFTAWHARDSTVGTNTSFISPTLRLEKLVPSPGPEESALRALGWAFSSYPRSMPPGLQQTAIAQGTQSPNKPLQPQLFCNPAAAAAATTTTMAEATGLMCSRSNKRRRLVCLLAARSSSITWANYKPPTDHLPPRRYS